MTDPMGCAGPAQLGGSSPGAVRWRVSARACRARPPPYNLLLTVRAIVTLQFVRLRASRMALACARRRAPEKNPGTRRRTAVRIVLGPSRSLRTSGRSTSRKRGKGRVTTPTAAGGSMASRHRRHGLPSSRTRPRALPGSRHPQPRDQSLHSSNKPRKTLESSFSQT